MSQTKNRACVFIDSNSNNSNQVITLNCQPIIKIPFPPVVDPCDLVVKTKDGRIPTRAPNAFIIYRKIFIQTAKKDGYFLPMTVISSMASKSWEQESAIVKDEFKRLAKEAYDVRNEMLPKSQRKRKREKWNIITFGKKIRKSPTPKIQEPTKKINQSAAAEVIQIEPQSINSSPIILQSEFFNNSETSLEIEQYNLDFTRHMTPNVPSPGMLSIEKEIVNSIDSVLIPSPDLSNISSPESNSQYEFNYESSPSNTNEFPIITEEELFNLLLPINEDYHNNNTFEGLGISDSIGFIPTLPESEFSSEMLDMFAYNTTADSNIELSCGFNFGYSCHL